MDRGRGMRQADFSAVPSSSSSNSSIQPACSENSISLMRFMKHAYDDRVQHCTQLIIQLKGATDSVDKVRQLWKQSEREKRELAQRLEECHAAEDEKTRKIRQLEAQLTDTRTQLRKQHDELMTLRVDFDENCSRMDLIKQVLKDQISSLSNEHRKQLAFLKEPGLTRSNSRTYGEPRMRGRRAAIPMVDVETEESEEGAEYDRTEEELVGEDDDSYDAQTRSGQIYRRSSSLPPSRRSTSAHAATKRGHLFTSIAEEHFPDEIQQPPHKKRSRECVAGSTTTSTEVTTTLTSDDRHLRVGVRASLNRSMSETNLLEQQRAATSAARNGMTPRAGTTSTIDLRTPRAAESWTRGQPIATRPHRFVKLTSFEKLAKYCDVCNKGANFKPCVRCSDCGQICHSDCKRKLVVPCVPRSSHRTPSRSSRIDTRARLKEYCPDTAPMIPAPIIHCVVALEMRDRLDYPGIYRIPGRQEQVKKLLTDLCGSRAIPKLELYDVETITDCIKKFLRNLPDPLIPKTSREEFVSAAQTQDLSMMHRAICDLPHPNRDTLAYLMTHWQKVVDHSIKNKMPKENLARVLAPTVVGDSHHHLSMGSAAEDVHKQQAVVLSLLSFEKEYWERFLSFEEGGLRSVVGGGHTVTLPPPTIGRASGPPSSTGTLLHLESSSDHTTPHATRRLPHLLPIDSDVSDPSMSVDQSLLGPVSSSRGLSLSTPLVKATPRKLFGPLA